MIVDYYCEECEKKVEIYEDSNGERRCVHCDEIVEEGIDVCDICGKKLDWGKDGMRICKECAEEYATAENIEQLLRDEDTSEEKFTELIKLFLDADSIKEMLIKQVLSLFNSPDGIVSDSAKSLLAKQYIDDEDYYVDCLEIWRDGYKLYE